MWLIDHSTSKRDKGRYILFTPLQMTATEDLHNLSLMLNLDYIKYSK